MARVVGLYEKVGVECLYRERPLSHAELLAEVHADRPVQVGFTYGPNQHGHVVVVIGIRSGKGGVNRFMVADPDPLRGRRVMDFDDLASDRGRGTWARSWIMMKKKAA
jgi:hypothetical protein